MFWASARETPVCGGRARGARGLQCASKRLLVEGAQVGGRYIASGNEL